MSSRTETKRRAAAVDQPIDEHPAADRLQRILVATDGSPRSAEGVDFAVDLAAEHGAELIIVHVVPAVDLIPPLAIDEVGGALVHEPTAYDHALLEDAAAVATEHGVVATTALVAGSTAEAIVASADAHDADLIVLSSRSGHGPVVGALLGSVSLAVLKVSTRPVLIVRGVPHHDASVAGMSS